MAMPTGNAYVQPGDPLIRNKWVREGMLQAASRSHWAPYTSNGAGGIIQIKTDFMAKRFSQLTFDYDSFIAIPAKQGKEVVRGTGRVKWKFSDRLTIDRYRWAINNGDKFDAMDIDAQDLTAHGDSIAKLADNFIRFKDQWLFDMMQGFTRYYTDGGQQITYDPHHLIYIDGTKALGYNEFAGIANIVRESTFGRVGSGTNKEKVFQGSGWKIRKLLANGTYEEANANTPEILIKGQKRVPLKPYTMKDQEPCWYLFVDDTVKTMLLRDASMQRILLQSEVRGNNRLMRGVIGKVGNIMIVEMPTFFGTSENDSSEPKQQIVEISGMSKIRASALGDLYTAGDAAAKGIRSSDISDTIAWMGTSKYDGIDTTNGAQISRCFLLGERAFYLAMGMHPEYYFAANQDYGIDSESAMEVWMHIDKVQLRPSHADFAEAKVSGYPYGIIPVDIRTQ